MAQNPAADHFAKKISALRSHPTLKALFFGDDLIQLARLDLPSISELIKDLGPAYYFLIAAAGLNRTTLKKALVSAEARLVAREHRKAFVIQRRLPIEASFSEIASSAISLRTADLGRRETGTAEQHFRQRLRHEGIPLLMSPPVRRLPGLLIGQRKPDGIYPDPESGSPPRVYLEIKNVRRVSDDIQKRLYEIAEVSLEMKYLYGGLQLAGPAGLGPKEIQAASASLQDHLRQQIVRAKPVVIALLLCSAKEAARYRPGALAFIDHVFFEEEIEDCIACLKELTLD